MILGSEECQKRQWYQQKLLLVDKETKTDGKPIIKVFKIISTFLLYITVNIRSPLLWNLLMLQKYGTQLTNLTPSR